MNASSTVISVDPRSVVKGALHPEAAARIIRSSALSLHKPAKSYFKKFLNLFFGFSAKLTRRVSSSLLFLRVAFAAVLICTALFSSSFSLVVLPSVAWIVLGGLFAVGLFVRLGAVASTTLFSLLIISEAMTSVFDPFIAASLSISLFLAICGPGRYSLDTLIRAAIFSAVNSSRRRCIQRRLSYRAYSQFR